MTKEQIIEGNKLIANFLGWKFHKKAKWWSFGPNSYSVDCYETPNSILRSAIAVDKLQFHTDWDWIIPILQKIGKLKVHGLDVTFSVSNNNGTVIIVGDSEKIFCSKDSLSNASTWSIVIRFIEWYNSLPK